MIVTIESMAHGGDGVAHRDGKAVFVSGAVTGDRIALGITQDKGRFERGEILELVEPSADRTEPPCPHFAACGGCQWQMARHEAQLEWKREIVRSQLAHLGRIEAEVMPVEAPSAAFGYRNRMDFRIVDGRPALVRRGSHQTVPIDSCHLLVPELAEIFGRLGRLDGDRLTLRMGVNTGETMVLVDDDDGCIHEEVAGHRFRITRRAFFQVNTAGAGLLVELVRDIVGSPESLVDAYAGGGLFAATAGSEARSVVAIESDRTALADLAVNVPGATVLEAPVEAGLPRIATADVVIVDPPRQGLGRAVVGELARIAPHAVAYVSCDPASFSRDARMLVDAGFRLDSVTPVDMFPQTYHVELVAAFFR